MDKTIIKAKGPDADIADIMKQSLGKDPVLDQIINNLNPDFGFGKRADGTNKGYGFYGMLKNPRTGGFSSELSIGVELGGQEVEIPSLVPGMTKKEIDAVLNANGPNEIPKTVIQKAADHALMRIGQNKSPFAGLGEDNNEPEDEEE